MKTMAADGTIIFRCPWCDTAHRAPQDAIGKQIACSKCRSPFTVQLGNAPRPMSMPQEGNWQAAPPPVHKAEQPASDPDQTAPEWVKSLVRPTAYGCAVAIVAIFAGCVVGYLSAHYFALYGGIWLIAPPHSEARAALVPGHMVIWSVLFSFAGFFATFALTLLARNHRKLLLLLAALTFPVLLAAGCIAGIVWLISPDEKQRIQAKKAHAEDEAEQTIMRHRWWKKAPTREEVEKMAKFLIETDAVRDPNNLAVEGNYVQIDDTGRMLRRPYWSHANVLFPAGEEPAGFGSRYLSFQISWKHAGTRPDREEALGMIRRELDRREYEQGAGR